MDTQKESNKATWQKPELIVLVRSKPEEAILADCKNTGSTAGPAHKTCADSTGQGCQATTTS